MNYHAVNFCEAESIGLDPSNVRKTGYRPTFPAEASNFQPDTRMGTAQSKRA